MILKSQDIAIAAPIPAAGPAIEPITGSGRGFSAGADLSERGASWKGSKDALIRGYKPFFKNIIDMPKPVIGSIAGPAAGIGAAIAMSCDLRIMSDDLSLIHI